MNEPIQLDIRFNTQLAGRIISDEELALIETLLAEHWLELAQTE